MKRAFLNVEIGTTLKRELQRVAKDKRVSVSVVARWAIEAYLKSESTKQTA